LNLANPHATFPPKGGEQPESLHVIRIQDRVTAYDWDVLNSRLRYQQPIKRVSVMQWQRSEKARMLRLDWQNRKVVAVYSSMHEVVGGRLQIKFAKLDL
jgi:hypothetical protein